MAINRRLLVVQLVMTFLVCLPRPGQSHGRLLDPPSRSSMWRFGFNTPPNYNDNELFCGGYTVHHSRNAGKCGICGDAYQLSQPRPNEAGGKYGQGIIVKKYQSGQSIQALVELTANHRGFFEFKLCPNNNPKRIATQECLDQYPLVVAGTNGDTKYVVPSPKAEKFQVDLELPDGLECSQCVFQWSYTAGNNWGICEDGSGKLGCGPQETFRGCADVAISGDQGYTSPPVTYSSPNITKTTVHRKRPWPSTTPKARPTPTNKPISFTARPRPGTFSTAQPKPTRVFEYTPGLETFEPSTRKPKPKTRTTIRPAYTKRPFTRRPRPSLKPTQPSYYTSKPYSTKSQYEGNSIDEDNTGVKVATKCRGVGVWKRLPGINGWCDINCARGYCPPSHCRCK